MYIKKTACIVALISSLGVMEVATAGMTQDLESGATLQQVALKAMRSGTAAEDIVEQFIAHGVDPFSAVESVVAVAPHRAREIVQATVRRLPEVAGAVVLAAMNNLSEKDEVNLIQAAIEIGADPTAVASATAAGGNGDEVVSTGIRADLDSAKDLTTTVKNARSRGQTTVEIVEQLANAGVDPFNATNAVIAVEPASAEKVVQAMVKRTPLASGAIVLAAMNNLDGEAENRIIQAAIEAGADPGQVTTATAAGRPRP